MALTLPVRMSVTVKDDWGIEASSFIYANVDPSMTLAQLETALSDLVTDFDACTDGQITRNDVVIVPALPGGIKGAPVAAGSGGARIEQTGLLNFTSTGTTKRWGFAIPGISNGASVLDGDRILGLTTATSADPVGVLIALITTAQSLIAYANDHQQQISAIKDALISFRKRRKQLQRSSFEVPS